MSLIDELFRLTNGGRDIIEYCYPDAKKLAGRDKGSFKLPGEGTASGSLYKSGSTYLVHDFRSGATANAISLYAEQSGLSFKEALHRLAEKHGAGRVSTYSKDRLKELTEWIDAPGADIAQLRKENKHYQFAVRPFGAVDYEFFFGVQAYPQAVREKADAGPQEAEAEAESGADESPASQPEPEQPKSSHEEKEAERMRFILEKYGVSALESYDMYTTVGKTGEPKIMRRKASASYPIYLFNYGTHCKLYEPYAEERRFSFPFGKDPGAIYGLKQAIDAYNGMQTKEDPFEGEDQVLEPLDEIIIASGEKDALCMAYYGYYPVWFGSEGAKVSDDAMAALRKYSSRQYLLYDLDATGMKRAYQIGLQHHKHLQVVFLPERLRQYRDAKNKPCKDFADWVRVMGSRDEFKKMLSASSRISFYTVSYREPTEKEIKNGMKADDPILEKYTYNNTAAELFFAANGFFKIKNSLGNGYSSVKIDGSWVEPVDAKELKQFLLQYRKGESLPEKLGNMIHRQNPESIDSLSLIDVCFDAHTPKSQLLFFKNCVFECRPGQVIEHKDGVQGMYAWHSKTKEHSVKRIAPSFTADAAKLDIAINSYASPFLRFLINTSRVHWKDEEKHYPDLTSWHGYLNSGNMFNIASTHLAPQQIAEQKQHLLNKIYAIGYLLHGYKDESRPWAVILLDNLLSELGQSNGGSGKSICGSYLAYMMDTATINGRNKEATSNSFVLDKIKEGTRLLILDDMHRYFDFGYFYPLITGTTDINKKGKDSINLEFAKSPKMLVSTNHGLRSQGSSDSRRQFLCAFSDWYHEKTKDNGYRETRTPVDDLGFRLMSQNSPDDWNADFNFLADCLSFYLSCPLRINPPMDSIEKRNALEAMGQKFMDWAEAYFADGATLNAYIRKDEILASCEAACKGMTANQFSRSIKHYCEYMDWEVNPKETAINGYSIDGKGRLLKKLQDKIVFFIFIKTRPLDLGDLDPMPF